MSTVTTVPETGHEDAADVRDQLRASGTIALLVGASKRFHDADGTTLARALGHSTLTTLIPAAIAVIGLVHVFDLEGLRSVLQDAAASFAPGPAGSILGDALRKAEPSSGVAALAVGLAAMLFSGTMGMTHLERAANRIYGVEEGRSVWRRVGLGLAMAATVEVMLIAALGVIVAGGSVGDASASGAAKGPTVWAILRWPIGVGLVAVAMTVIFEVVPNRRQPGFSWLLSGTTVAVTIWVVATLLLGFLYERVSTLGGSYGPLLGIVALLVWAYSAAIGVLFGLSFAAQLEAERAAGKSRNRGRK
jgi:YihY family inner membrane protein